MLSIQQNLISLINECDTLIKQNKINHAQDILKKILALDSLYIPAITRSFNLALLSQNFSVAQACLAQLNSLDPLLINIQLRTIQLYEAKQDYFQLVTLMQEHLNTNNNLEMTFKLGLNALKIGNIILAEQSFTTCETQRFNHPFLLLNFGHLHKAKGDSEIAAKYYNNFLSLHTSHCGTAYWSLADLKDYNFSSSEQQAMLATIKKAEVNIGNIALLSFALARSYEQNKNFDAAFDSMEYANNIIAKYRPFRSDLFQQLVLRLTAYSPSNKLENNKYSPAQFTPIFIVGMPRSGSTLVEQILASHSSVEATDELPYIERIALQLEQGGGIDNQLKIMTENQRQIYSEEYRRQALQYTNKNQQIIIDKNPNNFLHISLIMQLFPHAKIINVIRNPLDNALSVYKQYFSQGHEYSYTLKGIILYWESYLKLMKFNSSLFSNNIMNLSYESLTNKPEEETRNILAHCGLAFEKQCLTFYESKRVVLTPSVNQVKKPINKSAVNSWQGYKNKINVHLDALNKLAIEAESLTKS